MLNFAYDVDTRAVRQIQDFRRAEIECARFVPNTLAMDSTAAVYDAALHALGVDTRDVHKYGVPALRALFLATRNSKPKPVAMDGERSKSYDVMFPNARRLG